MKEIKSLPVKRQASVSGILKKLGVSRSGYNAWKKRVPSDTSVRRAVLKEKIQKIYEESHQNYGAPKITAELRKSGEYVSEKTVGNYMRQMGIKAHWVKPYIQTTKDSDFSQKLKNILNEEFNPTHPDAVWCSDITYIGTFEGFVYLTSVMDLYSRKIISWVLSETLEASHVVEFLGFFLGRARPFQVYRNPNIKSSNLFFNGGYFKTHYRFEEGQGLSDIRLTNEFGKIYKKFFLKNQIKNQIIEYQENEDEFRNYIKNEVDSFRPVLVCLLYTSPSPRD